MCVFVLKKNGTRSTKNGINLEKLKKMAKISKNGKKKRSVHFRHLFFFLLRIFIIQKGHFFLA